jgi:hypothetical protein
VQLVEGRRICSQGGNGPVDDRPQIRIGGRRGEFGLRRRRRLRLSHRKSSRQLGERLGVDVGQQAGIRRFRAPEGIEGEVSLCLRPRDIELCNAAGGTPARVLEVRLLGDQALIELGVKGLEESVSIRVDSVAVPEKGTELFLRVKPGAVLIFPQAGEGTIIEGD